MALVLTIIISVWLVVSLLAAMFIGRCIRAGRGD